MPTKIDKVIVTNFSALATKYSKDGLSKIEQAVSALIEGDKKRGLNSLYIAVDDATAMKKLGAAPVLSAANRKQNKVAIDEIYRALGPDYILLLGSVDVIPHQDMQNPMFSPDFAGDPDRYAFGDLPYACSQPYSRRPQEFIGPTRVVGRIPDLTGSNDPAYLLKLLKTATSYKQSTPDTYHAYFGITAEVWKSSTRQSLERIFGNADGMHVVPPKKDTWAKPLLARKALFVNCHGNANTPYFSGQSVRDKNHYPDALRASFVDGKITAGTVVAVECCYGGQLYDPKFAAGQPGVCNVYLGNQAYGFFACTTIAYGPSSGNGQADLICQYFLRNLLAGASLGRASLEARQKFARESSMGNPVNLKTLAQFNLYGDPSCVPVQTVDPKGPPPPRTPAKGVTWSMVDRVERATRRRSLFLEGSAISATRPTSRETKQPLSRSIKTLLQNKAREFGVIAEATKSFVVRFPRRIKGMPKTLIGEKLVPSGYHVLLGRDKIVAKARRPKAKKDGKPTEPPAFTRIVALVAKEVDGKVVSVTRVYSKSKHSAPGAKKALS